MVKIIVTDAGSGLVDFLFLADNTGSMGGVTSNIHSVAKTLVDGPIGPYANSQFAVARYLGDPLEPFENFSSSCKFLQRSTGDLIGVAEAIDQ